MKLNNIYIAVLLSLGIMSCDDFLNELPDQRTEITKENADYLLVSAYPSTMPIEMFEMYSDNADSYPLRFNEFNILQGDLFRWGDTYQNGEESPYNLWENCYMAIAAANQVLDMIEKSEEKEELNSLKGEALLCRAYNHFLLAVTFCKQYSVNAKNDLGIPYMTWLETTVSPSYERGNLEDTYKNIEKDLLEGLPLIDDSRYERPKFHFTKNSANAFAARFYLNYSKQDLSNYDQVIKYASNVLGDDPALKLRNWEKLGQLSLNGFLQPNEYVDDENEANLLLISYPSYWGYICGPFGAGTRYSHGPQVSYETNRSNGPWGKFSPSAIDNIYKVGVFSNATSLPTKVISMKIGQYSQIIDVVAGTGYGYCVNAAFTTDELALMRAEAYTAKQNYEKALIDINAWMKAYTKQQNSLTIESINEFYNAIEYYTPQSPTVKKELHPQFDIVDNTQENMFHTILQARRILTLHEGLRWLDVKRFGITIYRRFINDDGSIRVTDEMPIDDERRAIQIPSDVISAGMEKNPRK